MARPELYAAFVRGVMPTNCAMPALRACFTAAGCADVATVLGTGNVVFRAAGSEAAIVRAVEAAMPAHLGRTFTTMVRPVAELAALWARDPFAALPVPPGAKRVVSFLGAAPRPPPRLPIARDGAWIAARTDRVVWSYYLRNPKGPVFMQLLAEAFGDDVTTRTWDTVGKVLAAATRAVSAPAAPPVAASASRRPTPRSRR